MWNGNFQLSVAYLWTQSTLTSHLVSLPPTLNDRPPWTLQRSGRSEISWPLWHLNVQIATMCRVTSIVAELSKIRYRTKLTVADYCARFISSRVTKNQMTKTSVYYMFFFTWKKGKRLELVSKELNHLAATLHVNAIWFLWRKKLLFFKKIREILLHF